MAAIAVVAEWARRFASSWPSPCQAVCREFCLRFCLRFGFVPERQIRRENETAGWTCKKDDEEYNLQAERNHRRKSRSLTQMQNAAGEKNEKRRTGINRKKRRRKGNRNRHKKGMKARKETRGKPGKTGKDQTTTP